MQCPICGQELPDQESICPACGAAPAESPAPADETPRPEAEAPEAPAEPEEPEAPEEPSETAEPEESEESEPFAPPKKKRSALTIVLGALACLLLIAVVCLTIVVTTLSRTGEMPGFVTAVQRVFHPERDVSGDIAATIQDGAGATVAEVTNSDLNIYYWGEFFAYAQYYGYSFDPAQPLSDQAYDDERSWQDYFLDCALATMRQYAALKAAGEAAGYVLPEDYQAEYDSTVSTLAEYAQQNGFVTEDGSGDVLAYLQDSYGDTVTEEAFQRYLADYYYANSYSEALYNSLSFTDEEYESYYDENSDLYQSYYGLEKTDLPDINVRHILIMPETVDLGEDATEEEITAAEEKALADAKAEAERIYQLWLDGDATEESFAALAEEYSQDGSAANGGLIEDVYPGQMVEPFNDWCFDPDRQPGDTGIVESTYGFHIMYFSAVTDNYSWKAAVDSDLRYAETMDQIDAMMEQYTASTTDKMVLTTPAAVTALSQYYTGS